MGSWTVPVKVGLRNWVKGCQDRSAWRQGSKAEWGSVYNRPLARSKADTTRLDLKCVHRMPHVGPVGCLGHSLPRQKDHWVCFPGVEEAWSVLKLHEYFELAFANQCQEKPRESDAGRPGELRDFDVPRKGVLFSDTGVAVTALLSPLAPCL